MAHNEIDAIRALLGSKPRPVGWSERRQRLDEVGSTWPPAADVKCDAVDCDGVPGEWSLASGSDASRVLLYFHGGGYCSGSIVSHRRMVTEAGRAAHSRTLAIDYRRAPEHPYPAAHEDALAAWRFLRKQGIALIPTTAPDYFTADTPTAVLVRQVLGAIAEFEKTSLVAKLRAARERKKAQTGNCGGRQSHAEARPEVVALVRQLRRRRPKGGQRSLREISAELAKLGHLNERGAPYAAMSIKAML